MNKKVKTVNKISEKSEKTTLQSEIKVKIKALQSENKSENSENKSE